MRASAYHWGEYLFGGSTKRLELIKTMADPQRGVLSRESFALGAKDELHVVSSVDMIYIGIIQHLPFLRVSTLKGKLVILGNPNWDKYP